MPACEPWVQKYAPKKLEDVLGDPTMLAKFKDFVETKSLQHLLFCGRPGTGKSTCAKLIAKEITAEENILYINASRETGVDTIRNKVTAFCSMCANGLRVVILDEFDGMSWQAMETMRNVMDEFIDTSRFILTCNFERKIIEPIKSRCQLYDFVCPDEKTQKLAVIRRCSEILKNEGVMSPNLKVDLVKLINKFFPDVRRTINALQKMTVSNTFQFIEELEGETLENKLIDYLKAMDIKSIRRDIIGNVDYNDLYKILFNKAGFIHEENKLKIMIIVGEAARWHSIVVDPEINFVTCLLSICEVLG